MLPTRLLLKIIDLILQLLNSVIRYIKNKSIVNKQCQECFINLFNSLYKNEQNLLKKLLFCGQLEQNILYLYECSDSFLSISNHCDFACANNLGEEIDLSNRPIQIIRININTEQECYLVKILPKFRKKWKKLYDKCSKKDKLFIK